MREIIVELRNILTESIVAKAEIELIIKDAGLSVGKIAQSDKAAVYWDNAIDEALRQKALDALVTAAINYSKTFTALANFRESQLPMILKWLESKDDLTFLIKDKKSFCEIIETLRENLFWNTLDIAYQNKLKDIEILSLNPGTNDVVLTNLLKAAFKQDSPFIGSRPYSIGDKSIFFEINNNTSDLTGAINANGKTQILVQTGGCGKTSLINAGIIPKLLVDGFLIIRVQGYQNLLDQLKETIQELPFKTDEIPETVAYTSPRPVLIIFDQFETVYSLSPDDRRLVFDSVKTLTEKDFKILVACQSFDDVSDARINDRRLFEENLTERRSELFKFNISQAKWILTQTIKKVTDELPEENFIAQMVDDCVNREGGEQNLKPQIFQLIGRELLKKGGNVINEITYRRAGEAYGILSAYLKELVESNFSENTERDIVWRALAFLKTQYEGIGLDKIIGRISADTNSEGAEIEKILDDLVIFKIVNRKRIFNKESGAFEIIYAPSLRIFVDLADERVESETYNQFLVDQEFRSTWNNWKRSRDRYADAVQLKDFSKFSEGLDFSPLELLFLLRSAVEAGEPVYEWLEKLKGCHDDKGTKLIKKLQDFETVVTDQRQPSDLELAARLFADSRIVSGEPEAKTKDAAPESAWLTNQAVASANPKVRQTAVLTLTLAPGDSFKFENFITKHLTGSFPNRLKKRAELAGTLLDELPAEQVAQLAFSKGDKIVAWLWRVWHRIRKDNVSLFRYLVFSVMVTAAIFSLRVAAINYLAIRTNVILYTFLSFAVAIMIAGIIAPAMLIARYALPNSFAARAEITSRRPQTVNILTMLSGSVSFGIINAIYVWGVGWENRLPVIAAGFVAGFGIGAGLYVKSINDESSGWITGFITTSMFFVFMQAILLIFDQNLSLFLTLGSKDTENVRQYVVDYLPLISLIDALLLGASFYFGIGIGAAKAKDGEDKKDLLFT